MAGAQVDPTDLTRQADALDRAWDALVVGRPPAASRLDGLADDRLAIVRRLQVQAVASVPTTARGRVRQQVIAAVPWGENLTTISAFEGIDSASVLPAPLAAGRDGQRAAPVRRTGWSGWPPVEFAVACLVLLALAGAALSAYPNDRAAPGAADDAPPARPASLDRQGAPVTVTVDLPVETVPVGLTLRRVTLAPGGKIDLLSGEVSAAWVEQGAVTDLFGADGRPRVLGAGDHTVVDDGLLAIRNQAAEPAVLVVAGVFAGGRDRILVGATAGSNSVVIGEAVAPGATSGPTTVSLSRRALAASDDGSLPGAGFGVGGTAATTLAVVAGGAVELWVKSGAAEWRRQVDRRLGPVTAETFEPGRRVRLAAGDMATIFPGAAYEFQQVGGDEARLIVLTLTPGVGNPPAGVQPDVPGLGESITPEPEECRVAPRDADGLRALVTDSGAAGTPSAEPRGAVPIGTVADAATTAAVLSTVRELAACFRAGEVLRNYALYTDAFIRRFGAANSQVAATIDGMIRGEIAFGGYVSFVVAEVRVVSDGRAGAVGLFGGSLVHFTLVKEGDHWLIDAWDTPAEP